MILEVFFNPNDSMVPRKVAATFLNTSHESTLRSVNQLDFVPYLPYLFKPVVLFFFSWVFKNSFLMLTHKPLLLLPQVLLVTAKCSCLAANARKFELFCPMKHIFIQIFTVSFLNCCNWLRMYCNQGNYFCSFHNVSETGRTQ